MRPAAGSMLAMATSFLLDVVSAPDRWTLPRNALVFFATYFLCWMLMPTGRALFRESLALVRRRTADA